jgi:hypothetical protein
VALHLDEFSEPVLSKAKEVLRAEWDDRVGLVADRPPQAEGHKIFFARQGDPEPEALKTGVEN